MASWHKKELNDPFRKRRLSEQGKDGNKAKKRRMSDNSSTLHRFGFMTSSLSNSRKEITSFGVSKTNKDNDSLLMLPAPSNEIPKQRDKLDFFSRIIHEHKHLFQGKSVNEIYETNKLMLDLNILHKQMRNEQGATKRKEQCDDEVMKVEDGASGSDEMKQDYDDDEDEDVMQEFQLQIDDSNSFIDSLFD